MLILLLLSAVGAAAVFVWRRYLADPDPDDLEDDLPRLVFPVAGPPQKLQQRVAPPQEAAPKQRPVAPPRRPVAQPSVSPAPAPAASEPSSPAAAVPGGKESPAARPRQRRPKANGRARSVSNAGYDSDATLQLMPGRLEVVGGDAGTEEIRFVRPPGGEPVVTLGRTEGEAPAHVQLRNPTVSRTHARLRYEDGGWLIVNLSHTNPAVLNGEPLPVDGGETVLQDGDRLELGEVVLRYRCR